LGPYFFPFLLSTRPERLLLQPAYEQTNGVLANYTIFLEAKVVHGLVNRLFDLLPVRSSLDELIHILCDISIGKFERICVNYLRPVGSTITRGVSHNLCKILGVIHNEDMTKHLEMGKIRRDALNLVIPISWQLWGSRALGTYLQPGDECMVGVEVRDQLESAVQGDDLSLDVFLQDTM